MKVFIILCLLLSVIKIAHSTCGDIILTGQTQYQCSSPPVFTSTSFPTFVPTSSEIVIQGEIRVDSLCSATTPYYLMSFTVEPTAGNVINQLSLQWNGFKYFEVYIATTSSATRVMDRTFVQNQPLGQWLSFVAYSKNLKFGGGELVGLGSGTGSDASTSDSSSRAYLNPKIYMCSNAGTNALGCTLANLRVFYTIPSTTTQAVSGVVPTLIAKYPLNQYTGYAITDSANSLGTAYFGASSSSGPDSDSTHMPSWMPATDPVTGKITDTTGIKFSQSTQYVSLPYFPIAMSLYAPYYSFTIKLWLKLLSVPSSDAYVFRYSTGDFATDVFALKVQASTAKLNIIHYTDSSKISSSALSTVAWNLIIFTGTYQQARGQIASVTLSLNSASVYSGRITSTTAFTNGNTYGIRIGGPPTVNGIISDIEIYSPGTDYLFATTVCQSTTCNKDLGVGKPSICSAPKCHADCGGTSGVCLDATNTGCLTCKSGYGFSQGMCITQSCSSGTYADTNGVCQSCIVGCDVCSDGSTCTTCKSGYNKQNSICVCASGTYYDSASQICKNCPPGCDVCSDGTTCTTCKSQFTQVGSTCKCSVSTQYIDNTGTCQNCIMGCDSCSDGSTCDTCNAQFVKQTTTCVCPSGQSLSGSNCVCPLKKFKDNSYVCQDCIAGCDSCSDGSTCNTCSSGFVAQNSICVCSPGTYYDSAAKICKSCMAGCDVCSDGSTCTTCNAAFVKQASICVCPPAKYLAGSVCQDCILGCDSCTDGSTCNTCNPEFTKTGSTCGCPAGQSLDGVHCKCPSAQYKDSNYACQNCMGMCNTCSNGASCDTCKGGLVPQGSSCGCPNGKYLDNSNVCQNCILGCDDCSDGSTCNTCNAAFVKQGSTCVCPAGQYLDGSNVCQQCIVGCDSCADGTTCNNCNSAFIKQNSICVCPDGEYLDNGSKLCTGCMTGCDICTDGATCSTCNAAFVNDGTTCSCPSGQQLQGSSCVCPVGQYIDSNYACQTCIENCDVCSDAESCTTCKTGFTNQASQCVVTAESRSEGLSGGAIAGIAVASVIGLAGASGITYFLVSLVKKMLVKSSSRFMRVTISPKVTPINAQSP